MIGIYKITSPSKKVYIGQSVNIEKRFKEYKRLQCKGQTIIYRSLKKHGVNKHKFEIICECIANELNEKERYYQDLYSCLGEGGLNCRLTETSDKSGEFSAEMKKNLSEALTKARKGKPSWNSGKKGLYKHSAESREKISKNSSRHNLGKKLSEYVKSKINRLGSKHSEETKKKIGNSVRGKMKGIPKTQEHKDKLTGRKRLPFEIQNILNGRKNKILNNENRRGSSKYIGVSISSPKVTRMTKQGLKTYCTIRYKSRISFNGKEIIIGSFPFTPEGEILAAKARDEMSKKLYGSFAVLNFED